MEDVLTSPIMQKVLSNKVDHFNMAMKNSSTTIVPSEGLGLRLQPSEFQVAIKWWLGLDTVGGCIYPVSREYATMLSLACEVVMMSLAIINSETP